MSALGNLLRWASIAATALVVLGFLFFVADEGNETSAAQVARVDDAAVSSTPPETQREARNDGFREFVQDANDVLLSPFDNVVSSSDGWVNHGVPALLALLVYGVGAMLLLNYLAPSRR